MELTDISSLFTNGGTVVMAVLFIWVFVWIMNKLSKMLEENTKLLTVLTESNNNIAKALELLQNGCEKLDDKVDRNYEYLKYGEKESGRQ